MDLGLGGQVAVVTGGAAGIGRAISHALAAEGMAVVIADPVDGADADRPPAADEIAATGARALHVPTDVADLAAVERLRDAAVSAFGRVDVLVNNAAWWPTPQTFFWEEQPDHWRRMIDVILFGTLNCAKVIGDHMIARGSGAIVNIASDSALRGESRETTYSAAKAGVIGLTVSLAVGLGPSGVRVNCVSPGRTTTEAYTRKRAEALAAGGPETERYLDREKRALKHYPLRKFGTPQDVANMVVGLASPVLSGHVTGQVVSVSGGFRVG